MAVREHAVAALDLDRAVEGHRVHVRAQQDGPGALRPGQPREQVAGIGAGVRGGVVLLDPEPELRRSAASASVIARSRPDGLSISQ